MADLASLPLTNASYDFIFCLASIQHMPFADSISKLRDALAPGGVLAILGCFRHSTPGDHLPDLLAVPMNLVANLLVRVRTQVSGRPTGPVSIAPVMDPPMTLPEIRAEASQLLPGAVIRRRLYWRYSLIHPPRGTTGV